MRGTVTMKRMLIVAFFMISGLATALAQGSGSTSPTISKAPAKRERPFAVTKTVLGKITEIKAADSMFIVESKGRKYELKVDSKTRARTVDKKPMDLVNLQPGHDVRVMFRDADKTATLIQLR